VETGRWVLRGASTGISAIISPTGRVVAQAPLYKRAVLSSEIQLTSGEQPGPRWGPRFAWLIFALTIALVIAPAAVRPARRKSRAAPPRSRRPRRGRAALR